MIDKDGGGGTIFGFLETINFRKLKCNNHKVSFCFMEELPT